MNLSELQKDKEAEREEVSRKIDAGQPFGDHVRENSAFSLEDLQQMKIIVHSNGEDLVLPNRK